MMAEKVKPIHVDDITDMQILTIKNSINTYLYIQNHYQDNDDDFKTVYYDFYLKARSSVFAKKKRNNETKKKVDNTNWQLFFDLLNNTEVNCSDADAVLEKVIMDLQNQLSSHTYEFSFATKLLHTKCNDIPIFDSKVRKYLKIVYQKHFYTESKSNDLNNIMKDWNTLTDWYKWFLKEDEAKIWLAWFDNNFPEGNGMSEIKKIDSIIFACVE